MVLPDMPPDALFQFIESPRLRRVLAEHSRMDVLRGEPCRAPYDDVFTVFLPFQNRTGADLRVSAGRRREPKSGPARLTWIVPVPYLYITTVMNEFAEAPDLG